MLESKFKRKVKKRIEGLFPGCIIASLDPIETQGIPDMLILFKNMWASLEFKKAKNASHRPNQDYYVEKMNDMSFSSFIYPENEEEVIDALQRTFQSKR